MTEEYYKGRPSHWQPITDKKILACLGKLGEELNEGGSAASRCIIQGVDEVEPTTLKPNRQWLQEEIADIIAMCGLAITELGLDEDAIAKRIEYKLKYHTEWLCAL